MKLVLNKVQQGPALAKGSDSNGQACGTLQLPAAGGCVGGSVTPNSATVTYSTSMTCC